MNSLMHNLKPTRTRGVTLVELLVVVAILSVLTAIMIPRLRVINKDRNIREAARVVGSMMSRVSNRAVNEGAAGVMIETNPNFVDANGVRYAGTRMYAMRRIPPFSGDDQGSLATVQTTTETSMTISIPRPLEHTVTNPLIQVHDQIRLNHSSVRYRVDLPPPVVSGGDLIITLSLGLKPGYGAIRPTLAAGSKVPYVVYRQPRKLESSQVDLPDGYYIDLRLSGPLVPTPPSPPTAPDWVHGSVFDFITTGSARLYFNRDGGIDRYSVVDNAGLIGPTDVAREAFYLFVTGFEPESTDPVLQNPAAMWVTVDHTTGSVNVAYNAVADPTIPLFNQLRYARSLSETRQSANQ